MLSFMRRLFVQETEIVSMQDLAKQVELMKNKHEQDTLASAVSCINEVKKSLLLLQKQAEGLAHAPMPDKEHIAERVKKIVTSQQMFFVSRVNLLVKKFSVPEHPTLQNLKECSSSFKEEWVAFNQKTVKSFSMAYHLFYKELDGIKDTLHTLDHLNNSLIELLNKEDKLLLELSALVTIAIAKRNAAKEAVKQKAELLENQKHNDSLLSAAEKALKEFENESRLASLENDLHIAEAKEKQTAMNISSFFLQTKRQWMKVARLYPDAAKKIHILLGEPNIAFYEELFSLFVSAIDKKLIGNEDYAKLHKRLQEWNPPHLSKALAELNKVKAREEALLQHLAPIYQNKSSLTDTITTFNKKRELLQKQLLELEKIPDDIDKEKLSQLVSSVFGKQVVICD